MEEVRFQGVVVDRCTHCRGLWFDGLEKDMMSRLAGSEIVDVGHADVGEDYNSADRYPCPHCRGAMVRMVDARQPHIWFEQCSVCLGTFFDAGEFRDLKENSVADIIKAWFSPERR